MIELVNDLLNVSRLELGTFAVNPVDISIVKIAEDICRELSPQIETKHLDFEKSFDEKLPEKYSADPKLLTMIFQNLLSNAVKYTPEKGKVSLVVKKEKSTILIKISDTGYGIPKDQQGNIFKKLFRADNVREKDTEGTGLGLYIIKTIVETVKGSIWFESEKNKGTTFFVRLNLKGMASKKGEKALT